MQWRDVQLDPDRRMLRQFAGLWLGCFAGLAIVEYVVRQRPMAAAILGLLAVTVGPLGLLRPQAVRRIFISWSVLAFPIGWLVSWIIIALLFYGVFTPIGLVFRLTGRDLLRRRRPNARGTYWVARQAPTDGASYFRQT